MSLSRDNQIEKARSEMFTACYMHDSVRIDELFRSEDLSDEYLIGSIKSIEALCSDKQYISDMALVNKLELTLLQYASWKGFASLVERLLETYPDHLNKRANNGSTALHFAAEKGSVECITLLNNSSSSMRIQNNDGRTALHTAAFNGHRECIELLCKLDPELIKMQDNKGETALHRSAINDHRDCVEILCKLDSELIRMKADAGRTVLHWAAYKGHTECLKLLCKIDSELIRMKTRGGWTALRAAAANGHRDCVEFLCKLDPELIRMRANGGETVLHRAAIHGHKECVELLCKLDPELVSMKATGGETALHCAIKHKQSHVLPSLLAQQRYGLHIPFRDNRHTPLIRALVLEDTASTELLIDAGASVADENQPGRDAFYYCALSCNEKILAIFLRRAYKLFMPIACMVEEFGVRLRAAERVLSKFDITNHLLAWIFLSMPLRKDSILMLQGKLILGKQILKKDIFLAEAKEYLADFLTGTFVNELQRIAARPELSDQQQVFIDSLLERKEEMKKTILEGIASQYLKLLVVNDTVSTKEAAEKVICFVHKDSESRDNSFSV